MKHFCKKLCTVILSAVLCVLALPITISASVSNTITLSFSENDAAEAVISVFLPVPENLTGIDFTLKLSSETAKIKAFSTENTDTQNSDIDFDNIAKNLPEGASLTYRTTQAAYKVSFSGFFLEPYTSNEDFYLCDIIIASEGGFGESDTITFEYTLTGKNATRSSQETYFPGKTEESDNDKAPPRENTFTYPLGDADLSGRTDASDARRILRASVDLEDLLLEETAFSDSDHDGAITASDARYALRASVGLEKTVTHRFSITLEDSKKCADGGKYTFTCELTGISFSMDFEKGGHILRESDCFSTGKCIVCSEAVKSPAKHKYNDGGICTVCSADKDKIKETSKLLDSLIDEMHTYDLLAQESLHGSRNTDFISFTQEAAKSLKKAVDTCNGIRGLEDTEARLSAAYKMRFDAFISCMDENGKILSSNANCKTINNAVILSNSMLENLSF